MIFHMPYFYPALNPGLQVYNPGQGGPSGNPHGRDNLPQSWPGMTGWLSAMRAPPQGTPRAHPQQAVSNQYSDPSTYVVIPGLMKQPTYGG